MSESISKRVARLISGSVNALVAAVENSTPELVMEEALREIDAAIEDARAELAQHLTQKHLASKKLMEENTRHDELTAQLEVALDQGRDDLAEAGIGEQMDIEARIPVLESAIAESAAREKELDGFIQALQAKKREMRSELAAFVKARAAQVAAGSAADSARAESANSKAERAGEAFGRVMEKASGLPGRNMDLGNGRKLAELEDLARQNRVAERLAALKAGKP